MNIIDLISQEYKKYEDVFSQKEAFKLSLKCSELNMNIQLKSDAVSPYESLYNLSEVKLSTLHDYLKTNLAADFICRFISSAETFILFIKKKDSTLWLCVDYWELNAIMIQDRYLLSLISEILDRLMRVRRFTCLNMIAAYNLLWIKSGQKWMTAFWTWYRNFKYTVMLFRLCNAPVTFQSYMNRALRPVMNQTVIVYLNDVLIYSEDLMKHNEHVKAVLSLLQKAELYMNVAKCLFNVKEVKFLSFIIFTWGIHMNLKRVEMIIFWSVLQTLKDVQSFLSVSNFYRQFITHYSKVAEPLTDLTEKKALNSFHVTEAAVTAFITLKNAFMKSLLLWHFDLTKQCTLKTDVSEYTVMTILTQKQDDSYRHLIAFYSCKMMSAECNYLTEDQELLMIVTAFQMWRHYLKGARYQIDVWSDHTNLQTFTSMKQLSHQQVHWAEQLTGYDFIIYHCLSKSNSADTLSQWADYTQKSKTQHSILQLALISEMMQFISKNCVSEISQFISKDYITLKNKVMI